MPLTSRRGNISNNSILLIEPWWRAKTGLGYPESRACHLVTHARGPHRANLYHLDPLSTTIWLSMPASSLMGYGSKSVA